MAVEHARAISGEYSEHISIHVGRGVGVGGRGGCEELPTPYLPTPYPLSPGGNPSSEKNETLD